MYMLIRNRGHGEQRGAAAVEFALVLPVLAMLTFGLIQFGVLLAQKASLSGAVRDGARFGSVALYEGAGSPRTCDDVITMTKANAATIGMPRDDVFVSVSVSGTLVCDSSGGGTATDEPCYGTNGSQQLTVLARFADAALSIPATSISAPMPLESVGAYQCEY